MGLGGGAIRWFCVQHRSTGDRNYFYINFSKGISHKRVLRTIAKNDKHLMDTARALYFHDVHWTITPTVEGM